MKSSTHDQRNGWPLRNRDPRAHDHAAIQFARSLAIPRAGSRSHTDEFVVGWARELPHGAPFTIVVELPPEEAVKPEAAGIGEAFANYFRHRAEIADRDPRELFRVGWRSLVIGLIVLIVCLVESQVVTKMVGNVVVARVLGESLIIVGWVANWRPIEIYLYEWWPIRRRIMLFRRITAAPVEVRSS